jgi:hypothetical protein
LGGWVEIQEDGLGDSDERLIAQSSSDALFKHFDQQGFEFSELLIEESAYPAQIVPPLYEEVDIGEERPVCCLKNGLWLLESDGTRLAVLLERYAPFSQIQGMRLQWLRRLPQPTHPAAARIAQAARRRSDRPRYPRRRDERGVVQSPQQNRPPLVAPPRV